MVDETDKPEENDFFAGDFGGDDDFLSADREAGATSSEKPNLKEILKQNPSLKVFGVIACIGIFFIAFMVFGSSSDDKQAEETSNVRSGANVVQAPGTSELPPAYEQAVRQASEQRAEEAEKSGGSALPTLIQRPSERIEAPVQVEETDPLSAWRREAEARRMERQKAPDQNVPSLLPTTPPSGSAAAGSTAPTSQVGNLNSTTPAAQAPPPLPTEPNPEMVQALAQQIQQQMNTVMESQIPKESVVVSMNIQPAYDMRKYFPVPTEQVQNASTGGSAGSAPTGSYGNGQAAKPLVQAGTIVYAQILTEANSDVPGPVLAEIASGPLTGGRAIGQFQVAQRKLVLQFNRVVKDGIEYNTQGFALDPGTTLPAVASSVDDHLFSRVFLPAAASFIEGFADAATQTDTQVVVSNGTVVTNNTNDLDTKQELLKGVNQGAQKFSEIIDSYSNRPITVRVHVGTRIGLLFLSSIYDPTNDCREFTDWWTATTRSRVWWKQYLRTNHAESILWKLRGEPGL